MSQFEISPEGRLEAAKHHPQLMQAALALGDNDLPTAEQLLRDFLKKKSNRCGGHSHVGRIGDAAWSLC
jgi:hypothetical protein